VPTLEERVTRLEIDMDEQKRLRASQDRDLADIGEKLRIQTDLMKALAETQSEHTATLTQHTATLDRHTATLDKHSAVLDRHTAMHKEHGASLARLTLTVHGLSDGVERIIGMLDTLIERDDRQ
jgi:hypothetical protein